MQQEGKCLLIKFGSDIIGSRANIQSQKMINQFFIRCSKKKLGKEFVGKNVEWLRILRKFPLWGAFPSGQTISLAGAGPLPLVKKPHQELHSKPTQGNIVKSIKWSYGPRLFDTDGHSQYIKWEMQVREQKVEKVKDRKLFQNTKFLNSGG